VQPLDTDTNLADLQHYVAVMEAERGFTDRTVIEQALQLGEEVGELFKAIRKNQNLATATGAIIGSVDEGGLNWSSRRLSMIFWMRRVMG
jgi:hypothetical protein